jgi:hypothetical protein
MDAALAADFDAPAALNWLKDGLKNDRLSENAKFRLLQTMDLAIGLGLALGDEPEFSLAAKTPAPKAGIAAPLRNGGPTND